MQLGGRKLPRRLFSTCLSPGMVLYSSQSATVIPAAFSQQGSQRLPSSKVAARCHGLLPDGPSPAGCSETLADAEGT